MKYKLGRKYLITTDSWFLAPDGESYKAVFGTLVGVFADTEILGGIKPNRNSANWYVEIGNMIIAGCQIHYALRTDNCSSFGQSRDLEHNGEILHSREGHSRIYKAQEPKDE